MAIGILLLTALSLNAKEKEEVMSNEAFITLNSEITTCSTPVLSSNASIGFIEYFNKMFDSSRWPARWTCGQWPENEGWLYILSDLTIFLAYMSIPIMLLWYIRHKKLGKMVWVVVLFGAFIVLCGFTHLIDVVLFWNPVYRFSGFVKLITGVVSMGTAVVMGFVIPAALKFKSPQEMHEEINERTKLQDIFDIFLKYSPGATAMFDRDMKYLMVNESWYKDYNLEGEDVLGKSHYHFFPELLGMPEKIAEHKRVLNGETIKKDKETVLVNGRREIFRLKLLPWYNPDGSIGGVIQFTEALTETEKLREKLISAVEKTKNQSETIMEFSEIARMGAWELDLESNELRLGDGICDILETEKGTVLALEDCFTITHEDYVEVLSQAIDKAINEVKPYDVEVKIQTMKGNVLWARAIGQPITNDEGVVTSLKGMVQDIDAKKKVELLLEETNKNLEVEVSNRTKELSDTIDHLQSTQNQLVESEKLASLGQLSAGVAHEINTPLGAINASIGSLQHSFWKSLELLSELRSVLGAKEVEMLFSLLTESAKHKERLSTREERAMRKELVKELNSWDLKDSLALADRFVDMNLRDINQFKELILHEQSEPILTLAYHLSNEANAAKNIEIAVQKASKTVYALKSYSRFDDDQQLEEVDICENIETVLVLYNNQIKQGVSVTKLLPENKVTVIGYPDRLIQVWTNLLQNALQAMSFKGELIIDVQEKTDLVTVRIKDTGPGIPEEIQSKVFKAFFTTKPLGEGSGLGLDIIKKIIEKHNGEIWFETSEAGTEFFITLPKTQENG